MKSVDISHIIKSLQNLTEEEKYDKLYELIKIGAADVVDYLIKSGLDVNIKYGFNGKTPLLQSAIHGQYNVAKTLIDNGADVNKVDDDGESPLMFAVIVESIPIINLLIKSGANINHQDKNGLTALHKAVLTDNTDVVNFLLGQKKSRAYIKDNEGKTPLYYARSGGNKEIISNIMYHW